MNEYLLALKILFPEYIALFLSICISKTIWELLATQHGERIGWRWVNLVLAGAAVVVILRFSVLGRNGSDVHRFIWIEKSEPWECIPELYKESGVVLSFGPVPAFCDEQGTPIPEAGGMRFLGLAAVRGH